LLAIGNANHVFINGLSAIASKLTPTDFPLARKNALNPPAIKMRINLK